MNTAQHAVEILQAWRYADRRGLVTALDSASQSYSAAGSLSHLECERQEILESVVQHLLQLNCDNQVPQYGPGNGALALLFHLSSERKASEVSDLKNKWSEKRH